MLNKREWDLKQVTNNFPSAYVIEPFEEDSLGFYWVKRKQGFQICITNKTKAI